MICHTLCVKPLHEEDDGDDGKCDGDNWQVGTDAFESFDGCGHGDGRGDDSVCQQGACANDGQQVNPLVLESAQQGIEGEDASLAIVVGTQRHAYIFDGGLEGECQMMHDSAPRMVLSLMLSPVCRMVFIT